MMPLTPPPSILRMVISSSSDPFTNIVLPTFFKSKIRTRTTIATRLILVNVNIAEVIGFLKQKILVRNI